MKGVPAETDFVVIGAGVTGLRAAIELAEAGRVVVLAKSEIADSTPQNGAAPLSDEDEVTLHLHDTLSAGDGLSNVEAVKVLLEEAPERIEELLHWSVQGGRGSKLVFTREGTQGPNRLLHAQGDSTAREIVRALRGRARSIKNISICEFQFSTELRVEDGRVCGVSLLDEKGLPQEISTSAVLLATGGLGQIYRNTSNGAAATGDGLAMAFSAGAEVGDLEFIQFHPMVLYLKKAPRFVLSEGLLGGGAYLRNMEMTHFMPKYHPMAELAPRDVVARAVVHELEVVNAKDPVVYLDLTHLNGGQVQKRFPRIYSTCMEYNIDLTTDLIPVRPAAHYAMGGVRTDLDGSSSLPGLFAAGEAATTGLHGANRLPSNSLLEGLVFGARVGKMMRNELEHGAMKPHRPARAANSNGPVDAGLEELIGEIQDVMWKDVGVVRSGSKMKGAVQHLQRLAERVAHPRTRRAYEARNLHTAALLVARCALAREESRGAHYRIDFPAHNDAKFLKHSVVRGETVRFL
jgi:L-aspartate oxidase